MSDLIGLKKYSAPSDSEHGGKGPSAPSAAPSTARTKPFGSQGLWMGLLVVDSLLIAVFGSYLGVVGMKAYHQWNSKPAATAPAKSSKPAKTAPAKTETPSSQPPADAKAAAEPAKTEPEKPGAKAEPAKPAAKTEPAKPAAKEPPPPSLGSGDKRPAPTKEASPAEPAADANVKALPVDFSFQGPDAGSVKLAGAFLVRGGGKKDMVRGSQGEWTLTLYLKPGTYRYWFVVDGKRTVDPRNSKIERGASVVVVYPK